RIQVGRRQSPHRNQHGGGGPRGAADQRQIAQPGASGEKVSGFRLQNIARQYRNLAVRQKLRLVIMVTVTAALLCACAAVLVYDRIAARDSMQNDLGVLAEM